MYVADELNFTELISSEVIDPQQLVSEQPPVLVNRGWVPSSWREEGSKNSVPAVVHDAPVQEKRNGKGRRWFWSRSEIVQVRFLSWISSSCMQGRSHSFVFHS